MIAKPSDINQTPDGKQPHNSGSSPEAAFGALERQSEALEVEIGRAIARQVAGRRARHLTTQQLLADQSDKLQQTIAELAPDATVVVDPVALDAEQEPEEIGGRGSPLRRCVATGEILPRDELIRFVIAPDSTLTPDLDSKLPGRGYWVKPQQTVLMKAFKDNIFAKLARKPVTIPPALFDRVISLARAACINSLGLARRAWQLEMGYEHVRQALVVGKAGLVLIARNAPSDFAQKLESVRGQAPFVDLFTTAEISAALGRESLAYVSVNKGQWTLRLLIECRRLAQLLTP